MRSSRKLLGDLVDSDDLIDNSSSNNNNRNKRPTKAISHSLSDALAVYVAECRSVANGNAGCYKYRPVVVPQDDETDTPSKTKRAAVGPF